MSMTNSIVTLSGTAQLVAQASVNPQFVTLHNMTKSGNSYIHYGSINAGTANSPHIDPGETLQLQLLPGEALFALSDPTGLPLGVLIQRYDA
jgi:hypothetical protein